MSESDKPKLSELFEQGLVLHRKIQDSTEPSNSKIYQEDVKKAISLFEDVTRMVSMVDMFSSNESVEELPTEHIHYLALPALLGDLTSKLTSEDRAQVISVAEVYYKDFLKRTNSYGVTDMDVSGTEQGGGDFVQVSNRKREIKMKRYKECKEMEVKLKELQNLMKLDHVDDEVKRKYYINFISRLAYQAVEDLESFEMERPMLAHRQKLRVAAENGEPMEEGPEPVRKPLKPIIITRDQVQKKVYGLGYPSVPVMSVDEFYEQRVREGVFPGADTTSLQARAASGHDVQSENEKADIEKQEALDRDDLEALRKQRDWDDWKDDHRRGFGNTKNMG